MKKPRGLEYALALAGGAILAGSFIHPPWLMALVLICGALLLLRFFTVNYLAYTFCVLAALYGIGLLPFFVLNATLAMLVFGEMVFQPHYDDLNTYFYYVIATAWAGVLVMAYLHEGAILTIIFGIIAAVLLKVILLKYEDSLLIEGIGIAMTMYLFEELNYHADLQIIVFAVFVSFTFGYFAFRAKTADLTGLFSIALVGIILLVFSDARWLLVMLAFFIMGSAGTRYKYEYKKRIGVEQGHSGARGYRNVFSNGIIGCIAAVLYGIFAEPIFIVMYVSSIATAAADTLASEIGVTGGIPRMITTFKKVPIGTNGGVTWTGELVALLGGFIVSFVALALGLMTPSMLVICTVAAFIGTNIDSYVGATLENRDFFGNAGTNLAATIGGCIVAMILYLVFH